MSMITVCCPTCSQGFRANSSYLGQRVRCPNCMNVVTIPAAGENLQSNQSVDFQNDQQPDSKTTSVHLPQTNRSRRAVDTLLPPRVAEEVRPSDSVRLRDRLVSGDLFPAQQHALAKELVVRSTREAGNRSSREFQLRSPQPGKNSRFWKNLTLWLICTLILLLTTFLLAKLSI